MLSIEWDTIFQEQGCEGDVEKQWAIFQEKYNTAVKQCVPVKKVKTNRKIFTVPLDSKTLAKKRKKYKLWKRYLETEDGQIYSEYRKCSNQLRRMTRKIVKIHEKGVAKKAKENPKAFWNYVNKNPK